MTPKDDDGEIISKNILDWLTRVGAIATALAAIFAVFLSEEQARPLAFGVAILLAVGSSAVFLYRRRRAARLRIAKSTEPLQPRAALHGLLPFEETERAAREMAQVEPEQPARTIGHAAVRARWIAWPVLLSAIGWGVGFVIGAAITGEISGVDGWAFAGGIGGLATGIALQRAGLSRQPMERALVVVVGWAFAGAIGWGIAGAIRDTISQATEYAPFGEYWTTATAVGWVIGWAIFGAVVGLTLWRVTASLLQRQSLAMIGVWMSAGAIGWIIPQALSDMITAIGFAISPDEGYLVAAAINRIVAWAGAGADRKSTRLNSSH